MAAAAIFTGCQSDDIVEGTGSNNNLKTVEITAGMGGESRTAFINGGVKWQTDDALNVFVDGTSYKFAITDGIGENEATFSGDIPATADFTNNVAYYPYGDNVKVSQANGVYTVSAQYPTVQQYAEGGSFGPNSLPMIGQNGNVTADKYSFDFKTLGGWLQLYVKGNATITKVVMKAGKGQKIAGDYTVTATATPKMEMGETAVRYVALDCAAGVQLKENEAILFTFAVAPFTFAADEVSFDLYDNEGKFIPNAYTITKAGTIIANAYYTLAKNSPVVWDAAKAKVPAAKIGEIAYASVQEAIADVEDGETITLCKDVEVTEPAFGQNALNYVKTVNSTIDLNGNTLKANTGNSVFRFNITSTGATQDVTVTIKNGKVIAGSDTWCALMAANSDEGAKAILNLENLIVENSKPGDLAIKAWEGSLINATDVTINSTKAAGGFYALGGEMVLDNCTVSQEGLYTAPYLSMAFAVSNGGKMTINSGTYSSVPTAASEGNNQGTSHGSWVGGVMNSGGTLIINGGTFANGNFGEDNLATAARGLLMVDTAAKLEVNGGEFNALAKIVDYQNNLGDASKNPVVTIKGGTFSADPTKSASYVNGDKFLPEGYAAVEKDGKWTVEEALDAADLQEAINNADENEVISLNADVELTESLVIPEGKEITIDLNGKKLTTIYDETSNRHLYAINNYGELIIKGKEGSIVKSRGVYNYGKLTLNSGTIDACDGDGGYAINNQVNSTFVMDGGFVTASYEDDNKVDLGGYDATPVKVPQNSIVTINGGKIENVCDFTSAFNIASGGELIINGGEFISIHTLIYNEGKLTINDGQFTCNGITGVTSHCVFVLNKDADPENTKIMGGVFKHTATDQDATGASVINGAMTVYGGTFTGRIANYGGSPVLKGGVYSVEPKVQYVPEGYDVNKNETTGLWTVVELGYTKAENGDITVKSLVGLKNALTMAGAAGAGDTNITLSGDMDMTGVEWTPIKVDGYHGADIVTLDGNYATIKGLTAPLFAGGFAGGSGIVIKNLTIDASTIVSTNETGSGAFVESSDSQSKVELVNCHLKNSTVTGSRTGGLVGWTSGYNNVNDGPVKSYITLKDCSVTNCTITGSSVGGLNGHVGANAWTYTAIENCTVTGCTLNSTDDGEWRVGVAVGTANVGEVTITNLTENDNTLTQTGKTAPTGEKRNYFGRFVPNTTGKLVIDGVQLVSTLPGLQAALNDATTDLALSLLSDMKGDVKITQKAGVNVVIDGNKKSFEGVMTTFGKGNQTGTETLIIKNLNFIAANGADACILSPDRTVNNSCSYAHNVTVENCTFRDPNGGFDCAAIRHEDGGDKNWTIKGCNVDNTMHSILQVNNVIGKLSMEGCIVSSKNGANLNSCTNVELTGCNFDVKGYALCFGVKTGGNPDEAKNFSIKKSSLKSACDDGDAVIMFRTSAVNATLTLTETTLEGTNKISGQTDATKINGSY